MPPLDPDNTDQTAADKPIPSEAPSDLADSSNEPNAPAFVTLEKQHWILGDLARVILICLSLVAAGALIVVFLPQLTVDRMIQGLEARHAISNPEQIGFLYLGDDSANNELRVRGVVRNITALPIEQLDAIIRLYAHDRTLLETAVVRMSKETIDPGAIAQFELVYPKYEAEFGSYSVEFKLRQGAVVPYKDMRVAQERPQ
jgi:hypothetical protein